LEATVRVAGDIENALVDISWKRTVGFIADVVDSVRRTHTLFARVVSGTIVTRPVQPIVPN